MGSHVPRITHLCILGERVSGTCFVQSLISSNTKLKVDTSYGHKHFFQDIDKICNEDTSGVLFVFITRDIISWLSSMKNTPYHAELPIRNCKDFSKFIRMEWSCVYDNTSGVSELEKIYGTEMMNERDPYSGERFKNIIAMRTAKVDHCMAIGKMVENFVHVRYEDVRDDPDTFIAQISDKFKIVPNLKFCPVTSMRGKGKVQYVPKSYPPVSKEDEKFIWENIDPCTEKSIGYM